MKYRLEIMRQKDSTSEPYLQCIDYETDDCNTAVSTALSQINNNGNYKDINGNIVSHISWECSCLQKKCGACAMVINSKPRLACDTKLSECNINGVVKIEPLKKFPVVSDLTVDRSIMFENLKAINAWLSSEYRSDDKTNNTAYISSRCLQCGCCLEVCPNFYAGSEFFGTSVLAPMSRVITLSENEDLKAASKLYKKNYYSGCGKSLACKDVCPAKIDVDDLLVNSNAAAVWRIGFGKKKR